MERTRTSKLWIPSAVLRHIIYNELLSTNIPFENFNTNTYRFLKGDYNGDGTFNLYALRLNGPVEDRGPRLQRRDELPDHAVADVHSAPLDDTDAQFQFGIGDYNWDGKPDVYAIKMNGTGSGKTEVHILNGASNYRSLFSVADTATALHQTTRDQWQFSIGYRDDGKPNVYAIKMNGTGSGKTEVHVLNGNTQYSSLTNCHGATRDLAIR